MKITREIIKFRLKRILKNGDFSIGQRIDYLTQIVKPIEAEGFSTADIRDVVLIYIDKGFIERFSKHSEQDILDDLKLTPKGLEEWLDKVSSQKELRCQVLRTHYELSEANTMKPIMRPDIAKVLGFPNENDEQLLSLILFLEHSGLLTALTNVEDTITPKGIIEVEDGFPILLRKTEKPSMTSVSTVIHGSNSGAISTAGNDSNIEG